MHKWKRRFIIIGIIVLLLFWIVPNLLQPNIKDNSFLIMDISGDISEDVYEGTLEKVIKEEKMTLRNIRENIEKAKVDKRIKGIIMKVGFSSLGWGKIQEIRELLFDFRKTGKTVISYLEEGGDKEYYLCSVSDKIFSPPVAMLSIDGLSISGVFIRRLLDKVGIYPDFEQIEKYKTSADILKRDSMSYEEREMLNSILDCLFNTLVEDISISRKKTKQEIISIVDEGIFSPRDALKHSLIDGIAYFDEVQEMLRKENNRFSKVDFFDYLLVRPKTLGLYSGPEIALVYVDGVIMPGESSFSPIFGSIVGSSTLSEIMEDIREDSKTKAVILRVDSPGGSASASDLINREIILTKRRKPVVVSMSDIAASGGYYISCSASKIVASPSTLTGSIGVVFGKFNLKELYNRIGINKESIKRGKYAEMLSDTKNFTPEERERIKKHLWDFYFNDFLKNVSEGRKIEKDKLDRISRGRVWTGKQAKERGLVDEIGGIQKAIQIAKKEAMIADDISCRIVVYREKGYLTKLAERIIKKMSFILPRNMISVNSLKYFLSPGILTIVPYELDIR